MANQKRGSIQRMTGRYQRLARTQCTKPVPPGVRSEAREKQYPISSWPRRAISPWHIMNNKYRKQIPSIPEERMRVRSTNALNSKKLAPLHYHSVLEKIQICLQNTIIKALSTIPDGIKSMKHKRTYITKNTESLLFLIPCQYFNVQILDDLNFTQEAIDVLSMILITIISSSCFITAWHVSQALFSHSLRCFQHPSLPIRNIIDCGKWTLEVSQTLADKGRKYHTCSCVMVFVYDRGWHGSKLLARSTSLLLFT